MQDLNATAPSASLDHDIVVVGGGINGCGIARDLAGRGWRVLLCEQDDLASKTSSASTKLIHGGLRYLEYYEFGLVRKALQEREVLLQSAPHISHPLRFVMPYDRAMRPVWMIRLGLFLYDHLARRRLLAGSSAINLRRHPAGAALKPAFQKAFVYSDGWVDDARLVALNAVDAAARGAQVLTRTRCTEARCDPTGWRLQLENAQGVRRVRARLVVNAAGPQAEAFLREQVYGAGGDRLAARHLRLVKGSHIVVPRLFEHDHAYIFQNPDKRIIFAIPYEDRFTLIGTTDVEVEGAQAQQPSISAEETRYLCEQASHYLARQITPSDVVWSFSGVRPLLDDESGDAAAVTRDYVLDLDHPGAPLLSVWGGKITTYRRLAEDAADMISAALGSPRPAWTRGVPLPGGDLNTWVRSTAQPGHLFEAFVAAFHQRHPWLDQALARRWAHAYGSRVALLVGSADRMQALGPLIAPSLYECELRYLVDHEWARSADDVLWRRSKLGLHLTADQRLAVQAWFEHTGAASRAT